MEKELRRKPKVVRPHAEPERRIRLNTTNTIELPRPREHVQRGTGRIPPRRSSRRRRSDVRIAQIKLLLLCILIVGLALFVWKNLPG